MADHIPAFDQFTLGNLYFLGLRARSATAQDGSLERAWCNDPGKHFPEGALIHRARVRTALP
jgi:hypothetical protein